MLYYPSTNNIVYLGVCFIAYTHFYLYLQYEIFFNTYILPYYFTEL